MFLNVFVPTGGYKCFSKASPEKEAEYNQIYRVFTTDVKDCVVIYIKGKNLKIFAHFYRKSDPNDLLKKLLRDVEEGEELKICLTGGKFVNGYFPWYLKKRSLLSQQKGIDVASFQENIQKKGYPLFFLEKNFARESIIKLYKEIGVNAFEPQKKGMDFLSFHDRMKNFRFKHLPSNFVAEQDKTQAFLLKNGKDTTSYQNLAAVFEVISHFNLLRPDVEIKKIVHTYNPAPGTVHVSFVKNKPEEFSTVTNYEKLNYQQALIERISLKKSFQRLQLLRLITSLNNTYQRSKLIDCLRKDNCLEALKFSCTNELFDIAERLVISLQSKENKLLTPLLEELAKRFKEAVGLQNNAKLQQMDRAMHLIDTLDQAKRSGKEVNTLNHIPIR
ncbi:MAG: hypothetical protein H2069_01035 [Legionella sp.]|nr:hypothetical protein [Legionella sp.]